jgi:RNA polymerase sigma-70 factor, ECF subfamily
MGDGVSGELVRGAAAPVLHSADHPPRTHQRGFASGQGDEDARLLVSLQAARLGNPVAFEAIYRTLTPRLKRYARGLVGQDADDVVAEAWLQIVRDLAEFDGDWDAFRGWTTRIVRNRAIDHIRLNTRRHRRAETLDLALDKPGTDDTEAAAAESISTAAAIELVATLPQDQAEAVLLRAVVGLDAKSAGDLLGKRPGAVRVSAHRGLKTLARRLDETLAAAAGRTAATPESGEPE